MERGIASGIFIPISNDMSVFNDITNVIINCVINSGIILLLLSIVYMHLNVIKIILTNTNVLSFQP